MPRLVALALALALAPATSAQTFVAVAGSGGQYGYFNLSTRAYTQISANAFSGRQITGMAYDAPANTIYVNAFTGGGGDTNTALRSINQATGATVTSVDYNIAGGADLIGLTVNGSGQMYTYSWTSDQVATVTNKATAATTQLGGSGISSDRTTPFYTGKLAFVGSTLYGTMAANSGAANGLYSFNLTTGAATLRGNGSAASTYTNMIAFSDGSTLYGINGTTLYTINTTDGSLGTGFSITGANLPASFVGAVVAPVPEPTTVLGAAAAGLGLARLVRRRFRLAA